ncbi:MAG: hypothetical protein ACXIUZ_02045 [Lysobacteraceae bacterium]
MAKTILSNVTLTGVLTAQTSGTTSGDWEGAHVGMYQHHSNGKGYVYHYDYDLTEHQPLVLDASVVEVNAGLARRGKGIRVIDDNSATITPDDFNRLIEFNNARANQAIALQTGGTGGDRLELVNGNSVRSVTITCDTGVQLFLQQMAGATSVTLSPGQSLVLHRSHSSQHRWYQL